MLRPRLCSAPVAPGSSSWSQLAQSTAEDGRPTDALPMFREAYELDLALDDRWRMALLACRLATALIGLGELERAAQVLASGKGSARRYGRRPGVAARRGDERKSGAPARRTGRDLRSTEAWEAGRMLTADEAVALALAATPARNRDRFARGRPGEAGRLAARTRSTPSRRYAVPLLRRARPARPDTRPRAPRPRRHAAPRRHVPSAPFYTKKARKRAFLSSGGRI